MLGLARGAVARRRTDSDPDPARPLEVAFLHLGPFAHGVHRYGRIIAQTLGGLEGVRIIEHDATFTEAGLPAVRAAVAATWTLRRADVVIVSYCRHGLWSGTKLRFAQLAIVHLGRRRRSIAVLHDVYSPGGRRRSEWWALAANLVLPGTTVIHGEHDRVHLAGMPGAERAVTIPISIEPRVTLDRDRAREQLGVDHDTRILGMLGWIHPRKNYEAAIQALAQLGPEFRLWLIGTSPGQDRAYLDDLLAGASDLGVTDRLVVTGYIPEDEMALRLAALDLGLCPYRDASASASMATLIASRTPVVATDLAHTRELAAMGPRVVTTIDEPTASGLADGINRALGRPIGDQDFVELLARRSTLASARKYLTTARRVQERGRRRSSRPPATDVER